MHPPHPLPPVKQKIEVRSSISAESTLSRHHAPDSPKCMGGRGLKGGRKADNLESDPRSTDRYFLLENTTSPQHTARCVMRPPWHLMMALEVVTRLMVRGGL